MWKFLIQTMEVCDSLVRGAIHKMPSTILAIVLLLFKE